VHGQVTGGKARRHAEATAVSDELIVLRDEFPEYRIWREVTPGRSRYVARSRYQGASPHTVVTGQVTELRDALELGGHLITTQPASFSPTEPNIARMYGYWLQEKDNYAADRAAADAITEQFPEVAAIARANRAFLGRAVRFAARQGIRQFLDLGCGLPISPNVHEIAQWANPGARVIYVDHDPVVLAHARALLAADENVSVVAGDNPRPRMLFTEKIVQRGDRCSRAGVRSAGIGLAFPGSRRGGQCGGGIPGVDAAGQLPGDQRRHVHGHRPGADPLPAGHLRRGRAGHRADRKRDRGLVRRPRARPAWAGQCLGLAPRRPPVGCARPGQVPGRRRPQTHRQPGLGAVTSSKALVSLRHFLAQRNVQSKDMPRARGFGWLTPDNGHPIGYWHGFYW
jgi:hypothetical protein